jgi:predicted  nucleic acid-binding Zn-ribbon protein
MLTQVASTGIFICQKEVYSVDLQSEKSQIIPINGKEVPMSTQDSWQRIRNEFTRLTDVDQLKSEVHRISNELRKFDFHAVLSPSAQARVKMFERRYAELMRTMQQAQRQVDREFNKIMRQVKVQRSTVTKVMTEQRDKLDTLRKKFTAGSAKMKKNATKRATTKKTGAKKRRK